MVVLDNIIDFPLNLKKQQEAISNDLRKKDVKAAIEKAMTLINDGHPVGFYIAGVLYELKEGGQRDIEKAKFYYEKAVQQYGKGVAYLALAGLHIVHKTAWSDYGKAFDLYKQVAERSSSKENIAFANFMLGKMYYFGLSVNVNYEQARKFFEKGWNNGHIVSLIFIGFIEQKLGNNFKGWTLRLKAACYIVPIMIKNKNWERDPRVRGIR